MVGITSSYCCHCNRKQMVKYCKTIWLIWLNHKHLKWTRPNAKFIAMNKSKSCSLWTKCFIFLLCMPSFIGCLDSAWRKTRTKSHGSSVKFGGLLFTQDPRLRAPKTNAGFLFVHSGSFLHPLFLFPSLFCPFALRLERIRCSQKTKLGTSRFKCCLGWFLFTSMVRGFRLTSFLCVLLLSSYSSVGNVAWPTA